MDDLLNEMHPAGAAQTFCVPAFQVSLHIAAQNPLCLQS